MEYDPRLAMEMEITPSIDLGLFQKMNKGVHYMRRLLTLGSCRFNWKSIGACMLTDLTFFTIYS